MTAQVSELAQFELSPLTRHTRRHTAELRLLNSHCAHRKLAALKKAVIREGRRNFGIKEIGFPRKSNTEKQPGLPKHDVHLLVIEMDVLACSGTTMTEALEALSEMLSPLVSQIIQDVDQNVVAKDAVVPVIVMTRTSKARRTTNGRKQKKRELHLIRREKETYKRRRTAACTAFRDADLPALALS